MFKRKKMIIDLTAPKSARKIIAKNQKIRIAKKKEGLKKLPYL